jgi:tetratricopeptide (TPR) repeat protein
MHRFRNTRAAEPDPSVLEGADRLELEGELIEHGVDAIASLRPFGWSLPDPGVIAAALADTASQQPGLEEARELTRRGRKLDAMQALRLLLRDDASAIEPRLLLARLLEESDDVDEAIGQLSVALEAGGPSPQILVARGALYARTSRAAEAEEDFRSAIRQDPSHYPAYRYLGATLVRRGLVTEGEGVLREAVNLAPQDAEAWLHLGDALASQGQPEAALGALERASELAPTDPRSYTARGRVLDRLLRTEEALLMHRKAREVQNT